MKTLLLIPMALLITTGLNASERTPFVQITQPCQKGEALTYFAQKDSGDLKHLDRIAPYFTQLRASQLPEGSAALQLLAESLSLRKKPGLSPLLQSAANYGLARSLEELGFAHAAHQTHEKIILSGTSEFAKASAACTQELLAHYPSLSLQNPKEVHQRLAEWVNQSPELSDSLGALTFYSAISNFREGSPSSAWLALKNPWSTLARGLHAAQRNNIDLAVPALTEFNANPGSVPKEWIDISWLTLARALSETGRHAEAESFFHKVSKSSNLLPEALLGVSWQRLNQGKKQEAVGSALSLQAGHLARVFAPESLLVLSMAFNELCDYPRGQAALQILSQTYSDTALWLNALFAPSARPLEFDFEAKAMRALLTKGKFSPSDVPRAIETQWLASPVFQESLREKRLILTEKSALDQFQERARKEQARLTREIELAARRLEKRVESRKTAKSTETKEQSSEWKTELLAFRELIRKEKRYRQSAPFGLALTRKQKQELERRNLMLSKRIRLDLHDRTRAMKENLQWVAEQAALVEIEIQQGGSRDLILTHARGENVKREPARNPSRSREESWDWGKRSAATLKDGEIWEDELGSFEADLHSRCPTHAQAD